MDAVRQTEHPTIQQGIDEAYLKTVVGVTELLSYLQWPVGPLDDEFLWFYKPFMMLFTITHRRKEVLTHLNGNGDLIEQIEKWCDPDQKITAPRCKQGIKLFNEYQGVLFGSGLLSKSR